MFAPMATPLALEDIRPLLFAWILTSCGGPPPADAPNAEPTKRPSLTQEECEAKGGTVTGDIGDGATQRPDYVCTSGKPPLGNVTPPKGGPVAVEGSVCCPK